MMMDKVFCSAKILGQNLFILNISNNFATHLVRWFAND